MEELIKENIYVVDLGHIDNVPDIIFELSSVLDKNEAHNRRICLKLGNVILNQAQILSIKSLITGIDSILSSIDTKSPETEKTALSLGIIVSNISGDNTLEVAPEMTYKTAEEYREEQENNTAEAQEEEKRFEDEPETVTNNAENVIEDSVSEQEEAPSEDGVNVIIDTEEAKVEENNTEQEEQNDEPVQNEETVEEDKTEEPEEENENYSSQEEVIDELDVIFGSDPVKSSIFDMQQPFEDEETEYEESEPLDDITVPEEEFTKEDIELEALPTKYIKQTIRSGQVIIYEGNIVIIGDCHPGCEITAFGDITVWGVLSGIAHAGAGGNQKARVRALKMNAIQLRIANCYSRRPDSLNTVYIEKTNSFTPEEARIINGEIVVFKIND